MLSLWNFRSVWLYCLIGQISVPCARTAWPLSNFSNVQLLGLFENISITSTIHSRAMFKAAVVLSQQQNLTIDGHFIGWQSAETGGDVMNTFGTTCRLVSKSNIVGIVGPALSREAHVIAPFAAKINIPVISYASTDPELSDRNAYSAFYRTIPSDDTAALAIVKLFFKFNWTSCLMLYQNDPFGSGGRNAISEAFSKNKLIIEETIMFDIATRAIRGDLKCLLTSSSTRIVLVWAEPLYTALILETALNADVLGPQFTWILSSTVPFDSFNKTSYEKLSGMLTVEPVVGNVVNAPINSTLLNATYQIWQQYEPESFPGADKVDYYALFAFDATWLLIQALQQFCSLMTNVTSSCASFTNDSFCFDRHFLHSNLFFNTIDNTAFLGVSGAVQFHHNRTDRISGNYYVARNVQRSSTSLNYVPVLVWSDLDDWTRHPQAHAIIWPGDDLTPPSSYAAVAGVHLRIAVVESHPFTMTKEIIDEFGRPQTKQIGYIPDLIELLVGKMGFIPHIIPLSANQTYHGLIDAVADDFYDMLVADVTITAERMKKVAFSSSIFDNSLRIIIREASTADVDLLSYLKPFSYKLWITLLVASLYAGFLICLLERDNNEALRNKPMISLIEKSMWYSIGTLLGYGVDFHVKTAAGRLLTIGLYILSLVSIAAYTAKLASDLTIAKTRGIISGIDDIKNGKLSLSRLGILVNSSVEDYYLREISGNNRSFYPLKSEQEMYDKLSNNIIDAAIMDSGVLEYSTNNIYCNLTLIGADFDKNAFGIVFKKNWLYQQYLDVNILSLRELGVLDDLKRKWFQTNTCSRSSIRSHSMTIESMAVLFLTFAVISILALVIFAWRKRLMMEAYLFAILHRLRTRK